MLTVSNCKLNYYDDSAFIYDKFNTNLFIMYEMNENSNDAIDYWKPSCQNIEMFHKKGHFGWKGQWMSGIIIKTNNPCIFTTITINISFPNLNIIKKIYRRLFR